MYIPKRNGHNKIKEFNLRLEGIKYLYLLNSW